MNTLDSSARVVATRALLRPAFAAALLAAALAPAIHAAEPPATPAKPGPGAEAPKAAGVFIVVRNEAGDLLKGREQAFEDLVASRIAADCGLAVISRAEATRRLGTDAAGEKHALDGAKTDAAFEDRTSALALARNLGAHGILAVTLNSIAPETVEYEGNGIKTRITTHRLRATWKLTDTESAAGVRGDTVSASSSVRATAGLVEIPGDLLNGLLDDAAQKIATGIRARAKADRDTLAATQAAAKRAKFAVGVTADNLFFPELTVTKDGVLRIDQDKSPVKLAGIVVELDGAALGTAPFAAPIEVRPGLHKLRLSREGFKPWEGTVNVYDGFTFNAALELTEAGLARWREQSKFIETLKAGAKLTDAEITFLKAKAENLKNFGYKVDVKVEADKLPDDKSNIINVVPGTVLPVPAR